MRVIPQAMLAVCVTLTGLATAQAAPDSETAALIAELSQVEGSGDVAVMAMGKIGKASGWTLPRTAAELGLDGEWQVDAFNGSSGPAALRHGKTSGVLHALERYEIMEPPPGLPALVMFGTPKRSAWFMPFKKAGTILLVTPANRGRWIAFHRR